MTFENWAYPPKYPPQTFASTQPQPTYDELKAKVEEQQEWELAYEIVKDMNRSDENKKVLPREVQGITASVEKLALEQAKFRRQLLIEEQDPEQDRLCSDQGKAKLRRQQEISEQVKSFFSQLAVAYKAAMESGRRTDNGYVIPLKAYDELQQTLGIIAGVHGVAAAPEKTAG